MAHCNPRLLVPVALAAAFGIGGWVIEQQRARERSTLSGFFESQPIQVASRIGGRVSLILVSEGAAVRGGQPLLQLEAAPAREDAAAKQAAAASGMSIGALKVATHRATRTLRLALKARDGNEH